LFYDDSYAINVSSFWDLENLEELRLAGCGTIDLAGIGRLASLKTLYLYSNTSKAAVKRCLYRNIEEIGELPGLQELYLDESISSVEFLVNNVNLERLWLIADKERVDYWNLDTRLPLDISPLKNLRKLTILHIRGFILENAHFLDEFSQTDIDINFYETE
jgi:Leucine-rich repeat (LRR) protein